MEIVTVRLASMVNVSLANGTNNMKESGFSEDLNVGGTTTGADSRGGFWDDDE